MKRTFLVFILLSVIFCGNLYAQIGRFAAKNIISLSAGALGGEVSYERVIHNNISLVVNASYITWLFFDAANIALKGRFYLASSNIFLELGTGYSNGYNLLYADDERYHGFLLHAGAGWNIDIGKKGGFLLPVSLGLDVRFAQTYSLFPYLFIGLGYAF